MSWQFHHRSIMMIIQISSHSNLMVRRRPLILFTTEINHSSVQSHDAIGRTSKRRFISVLHSIDVGSVGKFVAWKRKSSSESKTHLEEKTFVRQSVLISVHHIDDERRTKTCSDPRRHRTGHVEHQQSSTWTVQQTSATRSSADLVEGKSHKAAVSNDG